MSLIAPILAAGSLIAVDLRCNALTDPLAIQSAQPQFSWKLKAVDPQSKNLSQSAYHILVASDPAILKSGKGDLWDSGKVISSSQFGIKYQGKALLSRAQCWWKVQVWDQAGKATDWSSVAYFGTGLKDQSDWQAQWIYGKTPEAPFNPLADAKWIGSSKISVGDTPQGTYHFRREFETNEAKSATITLTADNLFILKLNGKKLHQTTDPENWRSVQEIDLAPHLKAGKNILEIDVINATPSPCGLIASLNLGGINISTDSSWLCDGALAREIGKNGVAPWGLVKPKGLVKAPAQYFKKSVQITRSIKRATAYVTALGIVDFEVNGKRVAEDLFTPGWTNYNIRTHYRTFDITKNLKSGTNDFNAVLGQGWFAGYVAWGLQREHYGKTPMFKAQIEIEFTDGTKQSINTDTSWKVADGPILDEHFLHGEKFDARLQPKNWVPAKVGEFKTVLQAFPGDPVQAYQTIKTKSIKEVEKRVYQIDFGQNLSGFVKLKVNQPSGTKITIRHAERLDKNGRIYTTNLRAAEATDVYICKGGEVEEWNPRFTFHGFQYIEVTGLTEKPKENTFTAIAISSATPEAGQLETSDPMLNQLISNAWWTQKMNFIDVPTDCPQRDERLGWTGDAQAYILTASYYSDVQSFFTKWLESLDDDQREDGQYPKVAPILAGLDDGGPAWADAGVICPMVIYDMYGDKELLSRHYPNMKRFIEFCRLRSKPGLLPPEKYHIYGDWLSINANTPNDVITQAYFAGSTELMIRAAKILGHGEDAQSFTDLHTKVKKAFQDAFVTTDGKVKGETQCAYVLALGFDLLNETQAKNAADYLIADIEKRGWHLSTGFVGTRDLMHVLSKIGRDDVAFRLLHNTTFPSWGFTIKNGATSIWERWDGWTPEKGFQDPGMNSFAHYAYGAVSGWMFKTIGGISPLEAGFSKILIAPKLDPKLTWASTTYDSVRGPIKTSWKRSENSIELTAEVPPNTTAEIHVPKLDGTVEKYNVGSGTWKFATS
ncbi:MAG: family 78 glycoside hydrolase catalytic domain [Fimbriimonadaceae bacterium]|nr:family 78 glycoside hydrolase catalytic domain [Fimbriimonadaceae bacterium]